MNTYTPTSITTGPNLFNAALAVNGKYANYSNGDQNALATACVTGQQIITPGHSYCWSLPDTEVGLSAVLLCYDESGVFLGNNAIISSYPICAGVSDAVVTTLKGRKCLLFSVAADSPCRKIQCDMISGWAAHTAADFNRIVSGVQMVVGTGPISFTLTPIRGPLVVVKSGTKFYLRTPVDSGSDLVQVVDVANTGWLNATVGLNDWYTIAKATADASVPGAAPIVNPSYAADDTCPIMVNGTYIGGNHGATVAVNVAAAGHGKTAADVGSSWSDGSVTWYLLRVIDSGHLLFLSANAGIGDIWSFTAAVTGPTLTHVAGATHGDSITVASQAAAQVTPATQNRSYSVLLDGVDVITSGSDGVYTCSVCEFVDSYDIIWVPGIITYLAANVGASGWQDVGVAGVAAMATVATTFRFTRNGAYSKATRVTARKRMTLNYIGGEQAGKLTAPAAGTIWQYVNHAIPFTQGGHSYDLAATQDLTTTPDTLAMDVSRWTAPTTPPDRMIQFRKAADGSRDLGLAIGYNPNFGQSAPAIRQTTTVGQACYISTIGKQYLVAVESTAVPTLLSNDVVVTLTYRCPIVYEQNPDATCVAWYETDDGSVYVMLDYHQAFNGIVTLDASLANHFVTVIESNGLTAAPSTTDAGLAVTVAGSYGSATLKFSPIPAGADAAAAAAQLATDQNGAPASKRLPDTTIGGVAGTLDPAKVLAPVGTAIPASDQLAADTLIVHNNRHRLVEGTPILGEEGELCKDDVLRYETGVAAGGTFVPMSPMPRTRHTCSE